MGPQQHGKLQKKNNEPIPRKLTDRRKDGWKDRSTLLFRTLLAKDNGPKNPQSKKGLLVSVRGRSFNYCCFGPMTSTPPNA